MSPTAKCFSSLVGFGGKAGGALALNYYLVNFLSTQDFADWSRIISLFVIISVSDFGIGQYIMTTLMTDRESNEAALIQRSVQILVVLGSLVAATLYVLLHDIIGLSTGLLIAVVAPRLLFIPFGAALSAMGRFHERKLAEGASYLVAFTIALAFGGREPNLEVSLVVVNAALSLTGVIAYIRYVGLRERPAVLVKTSCITPKSILLGSFPYFINNFSSLLIYGGFIWFMGMFLPALDLAKLSVLHLLIFVNCYQLTDVVLRTKQVHFINRNYFLRIERRCLLVACILAGTGSAFGPWALGYYTKKYTFAPSDVCVYLLFASVEMYWLLIYLQMQVDPSKSLALARSSMMKCLIMGAMVLLISGTSDLQDMRSSLMMLTAASLVLVIWYRGHLFKSSSVQTVVSG